MRLDWSEFARALPQEERLIFTFLRNLILETEPRLQEKMNYGVPYFVRNRMVCFIWPISAPNAPTAKNQTWNDTIVSLGFCYGNKLLMNKDYCFRKAESRFISSGFDRWMNCGC